MLAIYKREVRSYFQSMVGCVFVAFLIAFTGIYFMEYNLTAWISILFLYAFRYTDRIYSRNSADHDAQFFRRA